MSDRNQVQTNVRIDPDVLEWCKKQAEQHDRSLSWTINHGLKQYRDKIETARTARKRKKSQG